MAVKVVDQTQRLEELHQTNKELGELLVQKDREITELQAQLAQAGKLATLGLQGAGIAHELNNPLTVISAEADEILDAIDESQLNPKNVRISAQNIKLFSERMRLIVDHIRQYARKDKGAHWTAIQINDAINDSLLLLRRQLETSGVSVNASLAEHLPQIWGQYNKLESVFLNIMANARDAFESVQDAREKKLDILSTLENDRILVTIEDNACGMAKDVLQKIYVPFFTTKTRENGTGIGLSIVRNIVQEHHGEISVDSELGRGTRFVLTFPTERRNRQESAN